MSWILAPRDGKSKIETNGTNYEKKLIHFQESKKSKNGSFRVHFGPALKLKKINWIDSKVRIENLMPSTLSN